MSQCATCHAGCCRSFAVPVTGADILRISTHLGLSFWDFVCRWADPQGMIARNHAPQFFFADEPDTPFVICLLHQESRVFAGTTKCQFLQEAAPTPGHPLGTAHCGIYENRPSACRAFPAKLDRSGELAIIYNVPESASGATHPAYTLCARQWTPADLDPIQVVQDLVVATYEMNFFHRLAQVWNEQPGLWNRFPEFIELVYGNRVRPVDELCEDEEPASDIEVVYPKLAA